MGVTLSIIEAGNIELPFSIWLATWVLWAGVFALYYRRKSVSLEPFATWLLRGSVLELLVASWFLRHFSGSSPS